MRTFLIHQTLYDRTFFRSLDILQMYVQRMVNDICLSNEISK